MSEKALWEWLREKLKNQGVMQRVENRVGPGTPDVAYCFLGVSGWIELKEIHDWPKRKNTLVRVDHFTEEQRSWLRSWHNAGGRSFLLLRVKTAQELLLFRGDYADVVGLVDRAMLIECASLVVPSRGIESAKAIFMEITK